MAHPRTEILGDVRAHLAVNVQLVSARVYDQAARPQTGALPYLVVAAEDEQVRDRTLRTETTTSLRRDLSIGVQVVAETELDRDEVCEEVEFAMGTVPGYAQSMLFRETRFGTRAEGERTHFVAMIVHTIAYVTTSKGEAP